MAISASSIRRSLGAALTALSLSCVVGGAEAKPVADSEMKDRTEATPKRLVGIDVDEKLGGTSTSAPSPETDPSMSLAQVLDELVEYLERFVVFPSLHRAFIVALWIAHTYRYDKDQEAPHARYPKRLVKGSCLEGRARDQPKTGKKAWLRRRLHGAIVRARILPRARRESHRECT